jgi:hypothetical protein
VTCKLLIKPINNPNGVSSGQTRYNIMQLSKTISFLRLRDDKRWLMTPNDFFVTMTVFQIHKVQSVIGFGDGYL